MKKYDIIHFEALGAEAEHLKEKTLEAQKENKLPQELCSLVTPETLQDFMSKNPDVELPDLITTKTHSVLPADYLNSGSKKSIITRSAGYDHFETLADIANITSLRNYCVNSVAQTAIKLMYATCGLLNHYENNTQTFERNKALSFMEFGKHRTATVFGVGKIGKKIYDLVEASGLSVQAVDVRADELDVLYNHTVNFVTKEQAIANSDIIINAMNLTRILGSKFYNQNYFSKEVLHKAKPGLMFINVTRGEIAPESALLELYDEGIIRGIGVDVFSSENDFSKELVGQMHTNNKDILAGKEMLKRSIERTANIYVQPHQAFNSDLAAESKAADTIKHVEEWYHNNKEHFDEQLPYYVEDDHIDIA